MTREFIKLLLKSPFKIYEFSVNDLSNSYIAYENVCKIYTENNTIKIKHGGDGDDIPTFTYIFISPKYLNNTFKFKPYQHSELKHCKIINSFTSEQLYEIFNSFSKHELNAIFYENQYDILEKNKIYNTFTVIQKYLFDKIFHNLFNKVSLYIDDFEDIYYDIVENYLDFVLGLIESEMDDLSYNLRLTYDNVTYYSKQDGTLKITLIPE